ncbi:MAG: 2-dehydropantoate 2-reductase [Peptococcaceae bacterium]|jgi:2-dehydropantoate 2-reductase|nr:2-dehydropantoate 2-reductase [Peptococcaceae bacterium]
MKTAILGAGAMGSLVGAHIKKGGGEVYFSDVFEEHMKVVSEKGITMELETDTGVDTQTVFVDGAVTSGDKVGVCDLVIVLVKCVDSDAAVEMNRALFGKDTVVITLQNGVGGADILAKYFDGDHLGLGVLKSSANIISPGRIMGRARFANSPKGVYFSPVNLETPYRHIYDELEKLLCAGGMPAECNERTEEFVWDKLVTNVMINGIAALLQLAGEDVGSHEDGRLLQRELCREACEVANARGIKLDFNHYWHDRSGGEPYDRSKVKVFHYVSAVFDSYQKRKTEMDFLCGAIVKEGQKYGVPTPYNETVWRLVRLMQDNYDNKYKPREA